jgi:multisubunit Na+/H+ antiporter MnhB subunit
MIKRRAIGLSAILLIFGLLFAGVFLLHPYGEPDYTLAIKQGDSFYQRTATDDYFIERGKMAEESGSTNIVAAILFDYRGYDTLGEATVLFTAVAGATAMFRRERKGDEDE